MNKDYTKFQSVSVFKQSDTPTPLLLGQPDEGSIEANHLNALDIKLTGSGKVYPIVVDGSLISVVCDFPVKDKSVKAMHKAAAALANNGYLPKDKIYDVKSNDVDLAVFADGFGQGLYSFKDYLSDEEPKIALKMGSLDQATEDEVELNVSLHHMIRAQMEEGSNVMTPKHLGDVVTSISAKFNARSTNQIEITDENSDEFPLIHAVGRGAATAGQDHKNPRIAEASFGDPEKPQITIVGKGITYDTGGNNIKPGQHMAGMHMDMGGAAHALATAVKLASEGHNVRLVVPIAENAVDGKSYKPDDIIKARNGKTVVVQNTDAEGRMILADALAYAEDTSEKDSDMIVTFATLTGAAVYATGGELPAVISSNTEDLNTVDALATDLGDPVQTFDMNKYPTTMAAVKNGTLADFNQINSKGAGHVFGGVFLSQFVKDKDKFVHFDIASAHSGSTSIPIGHRAAAALINKKFG